MLFNLNNVWIKSRQGVYYLRLKKEVWICRTRKPIIQCVYRICFNITRSAYAHPDTLGCTVFSCSQYEAHRSRYILLGEHLLGPPLSPRWLRLHKICPVPRECIPINDKGVCFWYNLNNWREKNAVAASSPGPEIKYSYRVAIYLCMHGWSVVRVSGFVVLGAMGVQIMGAVWRTYESGPVPIAHHG